MVRRTQLNGAAASRAKANSMPPLIEVRPANDRGLLDQLVAELLCRRAVADLGPVDHHVLRADARPLDEGRADASIMAGADGVEHARIGNGGGIAFALQLEFRVVNAARHVGGEHQQQVDVVGRARRCRRQYAAGEDQDDEDFDYAHRRTRRRASR